MPLRPSRSRAREIRENESDQERAERKRQTGDVDVTDPTSPYFDPNADGVTTEDVLEFIRLYDPYNYNLIINQIEDEQAAAAEQRQAGQLALAEIPRQLAQTREIAGIQNDSARDNFNISGRQSDNSFAGRGLGNSGFRTRALAEAGRGFQRNQRIRDINLDNSVRSLEQRRAALNQSLSGLPTDQEIRDEQYRAYLEYLAQQELGTDTGDPVDETFQKAMANHVIARNLRKRT